MWYQKQETNSLETRKSEMNESRAGRKKKWLSGWPDWFTWNPNKYQEFLADLIRQRADCRGKYPYKWRENACRIGKGLDFHRGEIDGSLGESNENEPFLCRPCPFFVSLRPVAPVPFTSFRDDRVCSSRLPDCIYQHFIPARWKTRPPISRRTIVALNHDSFAKSQLD